MTIQLAYLQLLAKLYEVYDSHEAACIADMVLEQATGQRKIDRIMYKDIPVNDEQQAQIQKYTGHLLDRRPIQYVLGAAWFKGMKLKVDERVLVPRPETEELVEWIEEDIKSSGVHELSLIDIGTGSGCIPISIKKKMPFVSVSAIDISYDALQVAKLNAIEQKVVVDFQQLNFLDESEWKQLGQYNVIASNPPYISSSEACFMQDNVLKYEPHLALFVPDEDPLIFYKAIAHFAQAHLKPGGRVFVEINEALGERVVDVFEMLGFKPVDLKKDMQGKDRMVKATIGTQASTIVVEVLSYQKIVRVQFSTKLTHKFYLYLPATQRD